MILFIGNKEPKMYNFIKLYNPLEKYMIINKMCNLKTIKEDVHVVIPFGFLQNNGLISNTYVHMAELIMTLNVIDIFYVSNYNIPSLIELGENYSVSVYQLKKMP